MDPIFENFNKLTLRLDRDLQREFYRRVEPLVKIGTRILSAIGVVATFASLFVVIFMYGTVAMSIVAISTVSLVTFVALYSLTYSKIFDRFYLTFIQSTITIIFHLNLAIVFFAREDGRHLALNHAEITLAIFAFAPGRFVNKVGFLFYGASAIIYTQCYHGMTTPSDLVSPIANAVILSVIAYFFERNNCVSFLLHLGMEKEQRRSEQLLQNIFPQMVFERVKHQENPTYYEKYDNVSILFADIVGFTEIAASKKPEDVVRILDEVFSRLDASCESAGATKIKTIGDAYMAVAGFSKSNIDHRILIADLAFEFREAMKKYKALTGHPIEIRIGMHSGPVVAGIIGRRTMHFDIWGDTVNMASRLESTSLPGAIQVSKELFEFIEPHYEGYQRSDVTLKGKGVVETYILLKPRSIPHQESKNSDKLPQSA